jgi:hypothetical protein
MVQVNLDYKKTRKLCFVVLVNNGLENCLALDHLLGKQCAIGAEAVVVDAGDIRI